MGAGLAQDDTLLPEQRFVQPVSGPSYRRSAKWMVLSTVLGLAVYGAQVLGANRDVTAPVLLLMAAGAAVVLVSAWYMLTGRTTVDSRGIRQDWMFARQYRWHEIARARHVRMPFTSRLVISTGTGPFKAVHSGCRELDEAFRTIAAAYGGRGA